MGTQKEGGLVSRAVREALGTLVSPQVADQLIERALQRANLPRIPEGGRAIATFIGGALHSEIEQAVGSDAAELVAAQLAPIVAHATSSTSAVRKPPSLKDAAPSGFGSDKPTGVIPAPAAPPAKNHKDANTARMQLTPQQLRDLHGAQAGGHTTRPQAFDELASTQRTPPRRVLAATSAIEAVDALQAYLGLAAQVEHVQDLVGLLDVLEEPGLKEPIVVVDCQRPTLHVTSIAAIGEDLPAGTTVMLWGASEASWRELDRDRVPTCRWVRCSHEATTDDVGSLCAMLIGRASP